MPSVPFRVSLFLLKIAPRVILSVENPQKNVEWRRKNVKLKLNKISFSHVIADNELKYLQNKSQKWTLKNRLTAFYSSQNVLDNFRHDRRIQIFREEPISPFQ